MTARDIVYGRRGGSIQKFDADTAARCKPTTTVRCDCGRWLVAVTDVGRACWTCGQRFVLVDQPPATVADLPLTAAERAESERGLAMARRALGAA